MQLEEISKEAFQRYEKLRRSGRVDMRFSDVQLYARLSKQEHMAIHEHYEELNRKWPEVRAEKWVK